MKLRWLFAAASAAMLVAACSSSSSSSSGGGGTCDDAAAAICDRACTCSGDTQCRIITAGDSGSSAVTFKSKDDCLALYKNLGCANGGDAKVDYAKCKADITASSCGDSSSGKGVLDVDSCSSK